MFHLAL